MIERLTLDTTALQVGDVVLAHGMRVLLDTPAHVFPGHVGMAYSWVGTVQNVDAVLEEGFIPESFLGDSVWVEPTGWEFRFDARWNVQGNRLATWLVERGALYPLAEVAL